MEKEHPEQDYYDDELVWDADQSDADIARGCSPTFLSPHSPNRVSPSSVGCLEGEAVMGAEERKEAAEQETKKCLQKKFADVGQSAAENCDQALLAIPQASMESLLSLDEKTKQQHQTFTAMLDDMPVAEFRSHKTEQLAAMIETWRSDVIAHISDLLNTTPKASLHKSQEAKAKYAPL